MSTFTRGIKMKPVQCARRGLRRLLPPGLARPAWSVAERFDYAVGSLENPSATITVPEGFRFDGASVPLLLRPLFPMAHPDYIQAAALHDWLYCEGGSRRRADDVFFEALGVLGMAAHWRWAFWAAVRIGGQSGFNRKKGTRE